MSDFKQTLLRRATRVKKTSSSLVLGYTRAGRTVIRPTCDATDRRRAKAKLSDWTRGEHVDAARILVEHGAREPDPKIAAWCLLWASVHRDLSRGAL